MDQILLNKTERRDGVKSMKSSQESNKTIKLYPSKLFQGPEDLSQDGIASDTYVRGLILGHCDKLQHPVVIMQKNERARGCVCDNKKMNVRTRDFATKGNTTELKADSSMSIGPIIAARFEISNHKPPAADRMKWLQTIY